VTPHDAPSSLGRSTGRRTLVRRARAEELDAAGAVVRAAYEADHLVDGAYLELLADARSRSLEAEVAVALDPRGSIIGSVTFALAGSRWAQLARDGQAEFRMLGVRPDARGRDVGLALVRWCLDRARASGAHEVVLSSATTMRAAHRLYMALGFTRRPALDWSPLPGLDLLGFGVVLESSSDPVGR
jgi:ribosomal protein S18 acetylase RimI-like enzyme